MHVKVSTKLTHITSSHTMITVMANLKACLISPPLLIKLAKKSTHSNEFPNFNSLAKCSLVVNNQSSRVKGESVRYLEWVHGAFLKNGSERRLLKKKTCWVCEIKSSQVGEVGVVREENEDVASGIGQGQSGYFLSDNGWGVRRMVDDEDEMRKVALIQAEAFHVPKALFNYFFFQFFLAEVFAALVYKFRTWPMNMYACLVAQPSDPSDSLNTSKKGLVGVVDATILRDEDVLEHLDGAEAYLYVSGIAVLKDFRRQKVATTLLKACDLLSLVWGLKHLALRAYEDDLAACKLYSDAGYKVVSRDPLWTSWIGKKRRVLMVKQCGLWAWC